MNSAERFTAPQQSLKILLSAYSCEPGRGSEPGVGWNVAWKIAQFHRVWVLTRPDESKAQIEAELVRRPNPNLQFVYFTVPFWAGGWQWGLGPRNVHYYLWQLQAYWVGRRLHRQIGFDLVHHVTYVRYSTPSFLSLLPIPFVWGPVGGGETVPQPFWRDFSGRAKLYERLRCLTHRLGELDPFTHLTVRQSQVIKATRRLRIRPDAFGV
ncbi:hypothetical protein PN462_22535 [Spirulina sp. CS-785/01]|uniref:hypothetical protein n=1 Tax=Spirulina sp. CS-785/01 TaxID=3021716 RepID=UPI00232FB528|nr:hypothetical protein [Spirulina sp. CS-785/01]MDB9315907.1 hypothetical protein [Spirulina sp. CS-785/01]